MSEWIEPKVNWNKTDAFNYSDYNRIKNNLNYLHEKALELYKRFDIQDMGADKAGYAVYFWADEFNKFEDNLKIINKNSFTQNYGITLRFFENSPFIEPSELNRIESATLKMKFFLESQKNMLNRLSFRLGTFHTR